MSKWRVGELPDEAPTDELRYFVDVYVDYFIPMFGFTFHGEAGCHTMVLERPKREFYRWPYFTRGSEQHGKVVPPFHFWNLNQSFLVRLGTAHGCTMIVTRPCSVLLYIAQLHGQSKIGQRQRPHCLTQHFRCCSSLRDDVSNQLCHTITNDNVCHITSWQFLPYIIRNGHKVVLAGKLCTFTSYLPPEST